MLTGLCLSLIPVPDPAASPLLSSPLRAGADPLGALPPPPPPAAAWGGGYEALGSAERMPSTLAEIVRLAAEEKFSDVHLGVGEVPRFRAGGRMLATAWPVADRAAFQRWLEEILPSAEIDRFHADKDYDGLFAFPFARVRINLFETMRGPAMVLRLIPLVIPSLDQLGMPSVLKSLTAYSKGLVLVSGPTGSGKSTTLAAMIQWINITASKHIITIEDPVEFLHTSRSSLIRQREVGLHTRAFHDALRASLREDPDVILIGEIRDRETLSTAMEAAQTGHLVLGTLHTNSAVKTVGRVMGMFPPHDQDKVRQEVAECLLAVISQGLIRTLDGERAPYHDLLVNTDACRDYLQRGDLEEVEQIMARSAFDGMMTLNQSLAQLVEAGRVAPEEALSHSPRPNELDQILRGRIA